MAITYKSPGDSTTAAEWNVIFAAADAVLTSYFGGLSNLMVAQSGVFGSSLIDVGVSRKFFFFNPVAYDAVNNPTAVDPGLLHPMAVQALQLLQNVDNGYVKRGYLRQYNHGAITGVVGGLAVGTGTPAASSSSLQVIRLVPPTTNAWHTAVYPENGYGTADAQYSNCIDLDICLSVLKRSGYAITFGQQQNAQPGYANGFYNYGEVELVHNYDSIDIIVIGNGASFDGSWDKYNVFKVHNFGRTDATVSFPGGGVTVPPGGCKCIRRVGGTYYSGFNYFQQMVAGDPRFFAWTNLNTNTSGVEMCPGYAALLPSQLLLGLAGSLGDRSGYDYSKAWSISSLYSSKFAPASLGSLIFDLLCHYGSVAARSAIGVTVLSGGSGYPFDNYTATSSGGGTGVDVFWAYLNTVVDGNGHIISATIANGGNYLTIPTGPVTVAYNGGTGALFQLTFSPPLNFTGYANLPAMFALCGYTWSYNPTTQKATISNASSGGQILVDIGSNLVMFLTPNANPPVHSINLGTSYTADLSTTVAISRTYRLIATTNDTDYGGGIIVTNNSCDNDPADKYNNTQVSYTIIDPVQKLADLLNGLSGSLISVSNVQVYLTVFGPVLWWQEAQKIDKNFVLSNVNLYSNVIKATYDGSQNLVITRPWLLSQGFQNFFFNAAPPLVANHFPRATRMYTAQRAISHNGSVEPWQTNTGGYTTYEPQALKRFFESTPIGTEAPEALITVMPRPDGCSYMGPLDNAGVPAHGTEALVCEAEHYNALADQINGLPATTKKYPTQYQGNATVFLDFSTLFIVNGGSGYTVGPNAFTLLQNTFYITVTSVGPNGEITGIVPPTTGNIISYSAFTGFPTRPFPASSGTGNGATFDVSDGGFTGANFIPYYQPNGTPVPVDGNGNALVGMNAGALNGLYPRNCYWMWGGPTPGGYDPIAEYLQTLNVPIQSTLPGNYGLALPIWAYQQQPDSSIIQYIRDYQQGFNPTFAALVGTLRWITIDDARTLYAKLGMPFVLDAQIIPLTFEVVSASGLVSATNVTGPGCSCWAGYQGENDGDPCAPGFNGGSGYFSNGQPIHCYTAPIPDQGGGYLGDVAEIVVGFKVDPSGLWATGYNGQPLTMTGAPEAPAFDIYTGWTDSADNTAVSDYDFHGDGTTIPWYRYGSDYYSVCTACRSNTNIFDYWELIQWTDTSNRYQITYAQPGNVGTLPDPGQFTVGTVIVIILAEGIATKLVIVQPRNYALYSGGVLAADNGQEDSTVAITTINGVGGLGQYEHAITCSVNNAILITLPIDD